MPAQRRPTRHRRDTKGAPAVAISAQACSGSIMPAPVVPAVATTITGTRRRRGPRRWRAASACGSMRPRPSVSTSRSAAAADARLGGRFSATRCGSRGRCRTSPGRGRRARRARRIPVRAASARTAARCSWPRSRRSRNGPLASSPRPARRATARITWLSSSTGTGEEAELASCGLKRPAMRSAHCAGKLAPD